MSRNVWIVSDTHFGHKNLIGFKYEGHPARPFETVEEMDETIVSNWNSLVGKEDKVYHLGDVAIHRKSLEIMRRLNGSRKILIKGNHDIFSAKDYLSHFQDIRSVHRLDRFTLSHVPILKECLGDRINVHGHTHKRNIQDDQYFNACVEQTGYKPIALEELIKWASTSR